MLLNAEIFSRATGARPDTATLLLPFMLGTLKAYDINTVRRIAAFLSQAAHESGAFSKMEENLNYSAKRLAVVWPRRFARTDANGDYVKDDKGKNEPNDAALTLANKPEPLANYVYSNRNGNSDVSSGDGWKYRGRGIFQLTGKANYKAASDALNETFVEEPDRVKLPFNACLTAGWYWNSKKLHQYADTENLEGLSKAINGGLNGLDERVAAYHKAKAVLDAYHVGSE